MHSERFCSYFTLFYSYFTFTMPFLCGVSWVLEPWMDIPRRGVISLVCPRVCSTALLYVWSSVLGVSIKYGQTSLWVSFSLVFKFLLCHCNRLLVFGHRRFYLCYYRVNKILGRACSLVISALTHGLPSALFSTGMCTLFYHYHRTSNSGNVLDFNSLCCPLDSLFTL